METVGGYQLPCLFEAWLTIADKQYHCSTRKSCSAAERLFGLSVGATLEELTTVDDSGCSCLEMWYN